MVRDIKDIIEKTAPDWSWMKPRDPARIDRVLAKIGEVWKKHPDMRLGQYLVCFAGSQDRIFNFEDSELETILDRLIAGETLDQVRTPK